MTNREAIKEIQERIGFHKKLYPGAVPEYHDALTMAIAALEKQEPMKPEKIEPCNNGLRFGWCPKCECSQVCETANYCKTCGQALSWEEGAE